MFLKSLQLINIRSYVQQTINFKEGITLLAGDIGAGKSTILHAIEFALFGASRPDLPAESLLRKGQTKASVTLQFKVEGQDITVHRTLQKTKQGIRQGTGFIVQNDQKFELTAIELKAKIIEILSYPPDLAGKGKNYVYRYTIYCPQEEMKQILQESPDNRLDILRKIFHIEKYKQVRDNVLIYLRNLRKEITVLKTRTENLEQKEEESQKLQESFKQAAQTRVFLEQKMRQCQNIFQEKRLQFQKEQELEKKRQKLTHALQLQEQEKQNVQNKVEDQEKKKQDLILRLQQLLVDPSHTSESLQTQINKLQEQLQKIREKKLQFESISSQYQKQIALLQAELKSENQALQGSSKLKELVEQNKSFLSKNSNVSQDLTKVISEQHQVQITQAKINTTLQELAMRKEKFESLTSCPTCEQSVSEEHCKKIQTEIKHKQTELNVKLSILKEKNDLHFTKIKELEDIQNKYQITEREQQKYLQQLASLNEKQSQIDQLKVKVKNLVIENNKLMSDFQNFLDNVLPISEDLKKRILSLEKSKEKLILKLQLKAQIDQLIIEQQKSQNSLQEYQTILQKSKNLLATLPQNTKVLEKKEQEQELARKHYDEAKINLSKQDQVVVHQKELLEKLQKELSLLHASNQSLKEIRVQERWIDGKFIPLTQNIEKEIMFKIYHYCNELFSEWFELLTEGSELTAYLDSDFAPVIQQQGHQISFSYLSGGERTAAALAYRLALTRAINNVFQQMKTKGLLILDEPTDGFSQEQLQRLRDCLETIGLNQILVVSHESMMEGFVNHIITIEKLSGKSRIL